MTADLARVRAALDVLDRWKSDEMRNRLRLLPPCPRCKAPSGSPCVKPDGAPFVPPRHRVLPEHISRNWGRLFNSALVLGWRNELHSGESAAVTVGREIKASALYRALVRGGHMVSL